MPLITLLHCTYSLSVEDAAVELSLQKALEFMNFFQALDIDGNRTIGEVIQIM